jgi:hypothetical protein
MANVMRQMGSAVPADSFGMISALNDLSGPSFDNATDKKSFADAARGLIRQDPNSDEAKVYRALLTALGEKP